MRTIVVIAALAVALGGSGWPAGPAAMAAVDPAAPFDFNGDGYAELVLPAPGEAVGASGSEAGAVSILRGSPTGVTAGGDQLWSQDSPGIAGVAEGWDTGGGDGFGTTFASADFDRDGYADLAVGSPYEWIGPEAAGMVHVLFGSARGLVSTGSLALTHATVGLVPSRDAWLGRSLAAGDLTGDGYPDLAVGLRSVDDSVYAAGAIVVIPGSPGGLAPGTKQVLTQATPGVPGDSERDDHWGESLATGDVDDDGVADLVIGGPGEMVSGVKHAGAFWVVFGGGAAPLGARSEIWTQDSPGIVDQVEANDGDIGDGHTVIGDYVGISTSVGDFNGDGFDDAAVGTRERAESLWGKPEVAGGGRAHRPGVGGGPHGGDQHHLDAGHPGRTRQERAL